MFHDICLKLWLLIIVYVQMLQFLWAVLVCLLGEWPNSVDK